MWLFVFESAAVFLLTDIGFKEKYFPSQAVAIVIRVWRLFFGCHEATVDAKRQADTVRHNEENQKIKKAWFTCHFWGLSTRFILIINIYMSICFSFNLSS